LIENPGVNRNQNRIRIGAVALFAGMLAAATAPLSAQISLGVLVDMAQRNSSAVKMAQADVQRSTAALEQVKDAYIPNFSMGSTVGYSHGFPTGQPSVGSASMQSLVLSYSQIQYIKAARVSIDAAKLKLKDAREQVTLDVSTAYIELDTVNRELEAAGRQESFAGRMVEIEQQRTEAGVDPLNDLLEARLTEAQLKLKRLHLENRASQLAKQLAALTGMSAGSILPDHASIPEIPAVKGDAPRRVLPSIEAAGKLAQAKRLEARGDDLSWRRPQISFGAVYNYDSNKLNSYSTYYKNFTPNNISFGLEFNIPFFDFSLRAKARETSAQALRATVEAEEAQRQDEIQIASLAGSLRELDLQAEIAALKQQIAEEQLHSVLAQLELGNGSEAGANAQPQLSPKMEQMARIDERQKFVDAQDAAFDLSKARLNLLRALGHMDDWLNELHTK
jgi:outer membrane protein TolC